MQTTQTKTVDTSTLNSLLRGEMSAIETYHQALDALDGKPGTPDLVALRKDHREAADALVEHVRLHGGKPAEGSGPWGMWARAFEATSKLFGHAAALRALREGEEHGLKDYQHALEDRELVADCQALIRGQISRQQMHITMLDRLITQAA
jgi:hypothetical protein